MNMVFLIARKGVGVVPDTIIRLLGNQELQQFDVDHE
jgi:hypothetical protein